MSRHAGSKSDKRCGYGRTAGVIRDILFCMKMLSFRVSEVEAAEVQRWAEALGMERSEILRDALHRHLAGLSGEHDVEAWQKVPLADSERSLEEIADWGPAEDWAEWGDAAR